MTALKFTDKAPDLILPDQDGNDVNLRSFLGSWVVLYFYPKDDTPGCTTEAVEFTRQLEDFRKLQAIILGVSGDTPSSHCSFIAKQKLKITLLSDEDHQVQEKYGVWKPKRFMGREFLGTVRSTFLIDPNGRIAQIWDNVRVNGHVQDVLERLKVLVK